MANDSNYYRAQADRAQAEADAALLDNVRDRALRSAKAFTAMADGADLVTRLRTEREARTAEARDEALAAETRDEARGDEAREAARPSAPGPHPLPA